MADLFYNNFKEEVMEKTFDLVNDSIKVALVTSSYTPDIDTHTAYSDLTNEVAGTGYTAGGQALASKTVTQDNTAEAGVFDAADLVWSSSTITAAAAVIYDVTNSNKLIAYLDFGGNKVSTSGDFTIQWSASGIINLT